VKKENHKQGANNMRYLAFRNKTET